MWAGLPKQGFERKEDAEKYMTAQLEHTQDADAQAKGSWGQEEQAHACDLQSFPGDTGLFSTVADCKSWDEGLKTGL